MEKFGFHKVSNNPGPGNPTITHSQPNYRFSAQLKVDNCPSNSVALSNLVALNPNDTPLQDGNYIILDNQFVYSICKDPSVKPGTIGLAGNVRIWGKWSLNQSVKVDGFNLNDFPSNMIYIKSIEILIDFRSRNKANSAPINHNELIGQFLNNYNNQILQPSQSIVMDFKGQYFSLLINSVQPFDISGGKQGEMGSDLSSKGILIGQSEVNFYPGNNSIINLQKDANARSRVSNKPRENPIINPDFKLESLGIGGLDTEFQQIFRRAFASRIISPDLADKLGLRHVKGLLLYGPPGTGKTLIARQIGKMLNVREPKIVNGPEMLSKFVGASEENIRNLFKDAEVEYKQKGENSQLHIIIFDELDSVFKQRGGGKSDGTGVGDNVVNQLLSKMDGVDQLNNILIIGMTNRLDLIDTALLRPGRFEIQIEISLPEENGRYEILLIHTKKMKTNNLLGDDIDFRELAKSTKNFTGAELEGLVNSATSFAINNFTSKESMGKIDEKNINKMKVTYSHFQLALNEIKPAFGVNEENLTENLPHGIIHFNDRIERLLTIGQSYVNEVQHSETERLISVLFHGRMGVGKTALATKLALESKFPFIKILSGELLVGMSDILKMQTIDMIFRDVYKSPLNILIVDKIESIINYVPIGPRFSNDILQMLMINLTKKPPNGRRLLILGTTSQYSILKSMNMVDCFTKSIDVKPVQYLNELDTVMRSIDFMNEYERRQIIDSLSSVKNHNDTDINLGIKKLLQVLMNAKYLQSDVNGVVENILEAHT